MKKSPTYKNIYFWLVIGLPLLGIIASIATGIIAYQHADIPIQIRPLSQ